MAAATCDAVLNFLRDRVESFEESLSSYDSPAAIRVVFKAGAGSPVSSPYTFGMSRRVSKVFKPKTKEFTDLSEGFDRRLLNHSDDIARYGISGGVVAASYEQVQSLLAIATHKHIHVLGQNGVEVVYSIAAGRDIAHLNIRGSHLVAVDSKNTLYTWLLEGKTLEPVAVQALRGAVTTTYVEPSLDWLFLGTKDGTVEVWDLEAEQLNTSFKIKNQYFERQEEWRLMEEWYAVPRYHISPIVSICIHPLDLGMLLITYADGACLYSLKEGKSKRYFECVIPADGNQPARKPALTCATFSPNGEFVLIGCVDGTFAFFDYTDGDMPLQVRTLGESDINLPRQHFARDEAELYHDPISDLKWCCRQDPLDTFLVIAGGSSMGVKGVSLLDYGKASSGTPGLPEFFANPQRQRILPVDPRHQILALLPLGTASPYYNAHDPRCVLLLTGTGVSTVLTLPSGESMPLLGLPPALGFIVPPISTFSVSAVPRHTQAQLQTLAARRSAFDGPLLIGGSPKRRELRDIESRQMLCSVHAGTLVRISDISAGDLIEPSYVEIDASKTLPNTVVDQVVYGGPTGELALASESGTVVIYRLGTASSDSDLSEALVDLSLLDPMPSPIRIAANMLFKFDRSVSKHAGFNPLCVVQAMKGQITSLSVSDIGFVAIGYDTGFFMLVDLRGPAIFYAADCDSLAEKKEKSMFRRSEMTSPKVGTLEYATTSSFRAINLDNRLSLVVLVGTSEGRLLCLELLKENNGTYTAVPNQTNTLDSSLQVKMILGCNSFGEDNSAKGLHLSQLYSDIDTPDCLLVVSEDGVTSFNGLSRKIGKCSLKGRGATAAQVVRCPGTDMVVLAVAQASGEVEVFSIPELRSLGSAQIQSASSSLPFYISPSGDVVLPSGKNELALMNIFGTGKQIRDVASDELYDALKQPVIARPTISNWAWVTGTQWVRPADVDLIISGGNRPLSKRALERLAASDRQQALLERQAAAQGKAKTNQRSLLESARNAAGYDRRSGRSAYGDMQQGGQERGERVGQVNDMFDNLTKASGEWLNEIDKMTSNAKKSAGKAAFKSLLGF